MTAQPKSTIKSYFETGDKPTQAQFIDFIDSYADFGSTGTPLYTDQGINNNVYLISVPGVSAYASGQNYAVKIANVNTSASTLNVNGLGPVAITYNNGSPLTGSELPQNGAVLLYHSGGNFRLPNINPATTGAITSITGDVSAVGPGAASATLSNTTVSAGTYANPTIVVDGKGRITSATTGSSPSAGALTLLTVATAANSATIDFTSLINTTYCEYIFQYTNVICATSGAAFNFRTSSTSGAAFDSGVSDYSFSGYLQQNGGTLQTTGGPSNTFISVAELAENGAGKSFSGEVKLYNPSVPLNGAILYRTVMAGVSGGVAIETGAGARNAAAVINGTRFVPSSGLITSGVFRMFGVQKS